MATATLTDVAAIEVAHTSSLDEKHASEESVSAGHTPDEHDIELYGENVTFPTEEEIATLRRVADKMPIGAFAIVIVELCERFAFYGVFPIHLSQFFNNLLQVYPVHSKTICRTHCHPVLLPVHPPMVMPVRQVHSTKDKLQQQVFKTCSNSWLISPPFSVV